jgi:hypothetical protein
MTIESEITEVCVGAGRVSRVYRILALAKHRYRVMKQYGQRWVAIGDRDAVSKADAFELIHAIEAFKINFPIYRRR